MLFSEADILVSGALNEGKVTQPSGAKSRILGCTKCMSRIYAVNDRREGFASLRCGSLDNSSEVVPEAHVWVSSKQPWIVLPDGVPTLDKQPEDASGWLTLLGMT
jgi:hypothetical protein